MSNEHIVKYKNLSEMPEVVISSSTMLWNHTGSWRYIRPRYVNKVPPCNQGCPAGNDIENFVGLIQQGKTEEAFMVLKEENPFPRTCGRVCYHPCETACNRARFDRSVAINALERFAGDHAPKNYTIKKQRPDSGKRVAIIGSGPCGLAAAYHLSRLGHSVTVYEKLDRPGGLLRYGIPEYRLPKDVLDSEINDIIKLGVDIQCRKEVGKDIGWQGLKEFDAVLIATGVHKNKKLGIENETALGVVAGLELLKSIAQKMPLDLGPKTVVIGGGNTAIDAARCALRLGSEATILYHRSRAEMPAFVDELDEAEKEGVVFNILSQPVRVITENGRATGIEMRKTRLGDPDESGRRRPEPVPDSEFVVPASTIVTAIGESPDLAFLPPDVLLKWGKIIIEKFGLTKHPGVFAGGDVALAEQNVAVAIGSGKAASMAIDAYLNGADINSAAERLVIGNHGQASMSAYLKTGNAHSNNRSSKMVVPFEDINLNHFEKFERSKIPKLKLADRKQNFNEVHRGITKSAALLDANRCFHCGVCTMCDNCFVFCPDISITHSPNKWGYDINYDFCKGCGICVKECPRSAMIMEDEK
ncbi:MAG: FAD-dependent oxidoreductase [Deltaproteobacteria bacterium]|nr:FAD-dependent oxidoreductase [Deltaproteobacteria bacterium]